jgi:predicted DNA binding CopG/RHH family protein
MKKAFKTVYNPPFVDEEEQADIEALHRGEYLPTADLPSRKKFLSRAAENTLKRKPVTLRLLEGDIAELKAKAIADGLPYQTLLASVVHKFVKGRLVERD